MNRLASRRARSGAAHRGGPGGWILRCLVSLALVASSPLPAAAAGGGGGGGVGGGSAGSPRSAGSPSRSSKDVATERYEQGLKARGRAFAYEEQARESDEPGFLGIGKPPSQKALDQWRKAVNAYEQAVAKKPDFHQAYSDLGFAYRKLGDYDKSLAAYDRALEIRPTYAPAIEYRGEASLKLARLEEAKTAYGRLWLLDRALASQLMGAMQEWLTRADAEPVEGLSPDQLEAFREWVQQQEKRASQAPGEVSAGRSW